MSKIMSFGAVLLLHLGFNVALSDAFYVPGKAPVTLCSSHDSDAICMKSQVRVLVNRLNTVNNVLPYKYDDFDFCDIAPGNVPENIGQKLLGDRIQPSKYILEFKNDSLCKKVCKKTYSPENEKSLQKLTFLKFSIDLDYHHNWIVDGMPVTWCYTVSNGEMYCSISFPVGCYVSSSGKRENSCVISAKFSEKDTYYLFNHIDIKVEYQPSRDAPEGIVAGRIVRVIGRPRSINHNAEGSEGCDYNAPPLGIPGGRLNSSISFYYSYSVRWEENTRVPWAYRWDFLLSGWWSHSNVLWFSIVNSLIVNVFLLMVIFGFFMKFVTKASAENKDFIFQEQHSTSRFFKLICCRYGNGMRWTLIDGDVFRPPQNIALLSVFVSNGFQLTLTAFITLVFAVLGFLSPDNKGALFTCILIFCLCCSPVSGYISARTYKSLGGLRWLSNYLLTVFLCPSLVFTALLLLNYILHSKGSSAALPTVYLIERIAMWFGISLPLTFIGYFCGNRRKAIEVPVSVNESHHPIPQRSVLYSPYFRTFLGALVPFGCLFIQLFFILNSLWTHVYFYQFFPLFLTFLSLVVGCAEISMVLRFKELQLQNYHWWWRSFLDSGWFAVFVFSYCTHYFITKLDISDDVSAVLYFGYTAIFGFLIFLASGSVSFFASRWLVYKMYSRFQATK